MALAGVDDGQPGGARLLEQRRVGAIVRAQQRDVVAERRAKPAGLEKIPLHVDDDEARPCLIEIERVRLCLDDRHRHDTPL